MKKTSLDAYLIQVRTKGSSKKSAGLTLGKFDGGTNFLDVVHKILQQFPRIRKTGALMRSFRVSNLHVNGAYLSGQIHVGDYGTVTDIVDVNKGTVAHKKKKNHADMAPYFFMFVLPKKDKKGLLCMQRIGVNGVKGVMELVVGGVFKKNYPDYTVDVLNVVPADLMRDFIANGAVHSISVVNHEIPNDIANQFGGNSKAYEGTVEMSVKPKSRNFFKKSGLVSYVNGQKDIQDVFNLGDFEYDTIKAEIEVGGQTRMVDITKPSRFNARFDISAQLSEGQDGFPTLDSLHREFVKIAKDLAKRAGITP